MRHLGITKEDSFMIHRSPLNKKTHITILDKKADFNLLGALLNVVTDLLNDSLPKRVVIFCTSLKDCGTVYRDISHSHFRDVLKPITCVSRFSVVRWRHSGRADMTFDSRNF